MTEVKRPEPRNSPVRNRSHMSLMDLFGLIPRSRLSERINSPVPVITRRTRAPLPTGVIPGTRPPPKPSRKPINPVVVNLLDQTSSRPPLKLADTKCGICLEGIQDPASTICGHVFCFECIRLAQQSSKQCPLCRTRLNPKQYHRLFL